MLAWRPRRKAWESAVVFVSDQRAVIAQALIERDFAAVNALFNDALGKNRVLVELNSASAGGEGVPRWRVSGRRSVFSFHENMYSGATEEIVMRWIDFLPLALYAAGKGGDGACLVNLGDEGHIPGLAFCDNRPEFDLVPDSAFLRHRAYSEVVGSFAANPVAYAERTPVAFWRGSTTGIQTHSVLDLPRVRLCQLGGLLGDKADFGISAVVGSRREKDLELLQSLNLVKDYVPAEHMNRYGVHIDIDGRTNSWPGLLMKLHSGSPVVKVESPQGFRQWYYDRLIPWVNYVPAKSDLSDIKQTVEFLLSRPDLAETIGGRGRALALDMTFEREIERAVPAVRRGLRRSAAA